MKEFVAFLQFRRRLKRKMEQIHELEDPWSAKQQRSQLFSLIDSLLSPSSHILEIGSGDGIVSEKLAELCDRLTCVEISKRAVKKAKRNLQHFSNIHFICKDIYSVSIPNCDAVVLSFVLDYLGQNQFSKRFVWLMMDLCRHTREILAVQPVGSEADMKKIEAAAVILNRFGFELRRSQIDQSSLPHLFAAVFTKRAETE